MWLGPYDIPKEIFLTVLKFHLNTLLVSGVVQPLTYAQNVNVAVWKSEN